MQREPEKSAFLGRRQQKLSMLTSYPLEDTFIRFHTVALLHTSQISLSAPECWRTRLPRALRSLQSVQHNCASCECGPSLGRYDLPALPCELSHLVCSIKDDRYGWPWWPKQCTLCMHNRAYCIVINGNLMVEPRTNTQPTACTMYIDRPADATR
ncbi:hypothetical protein BDW22DRAFT_1363573 [Trametopsis cervina]|nr:hypothetical protein BDW22DRAFT_1363573 [Trametopsis cervina]